jgi:predicted transcriptional regulator
MFLASDVMEKTFHKLSPDLTIADAIALFRQASEEEGRRVFGMVVVDEEESLIGMLSMYDILLFVRPKHIQVWGTMKDIDVTGLLEAHSEKARSVRVDDIMTTDVVTVSPDTHCMAILDTMMRKHIRRIPVVQDGTVQGIVYLSNLFYFLMDRMVP